MVASVSILFLQDSCVPFLRRWVVQRQEWFASWGRQTLPRESGVEWSSMNPLGKMMGRWQAPGAVNHHCNSPQTHKVFLKEGCSLLMTYSCCLFLSLTDTFSACPGMGSLLQSTRSHVSVFPAPPQPRPRAHGGGPAWRGVLAPPLSAHSAPPPLLSAVGPAEQAW